MEEAVQDQRFAHIAKDPRFRSIPKKEKKIVVDKRFQGMFHDKRFKLQYAMDKRGRKIPHSTTEDLKKFYDVHTSEDSEEEETKPTDPKDFPNSENKLSTSKKNHRMVWTIKDQPLDVSEDESSDSSPSHQKTYLNSEPEDPAKSDSDSTDADVGKKEIDLARGEGNVETSSSSDYEESSQDEDSDNELDHKWGELDADAPQTDTVTRRLAVCNMNWDRIKADDLFVIFNSFKPLDATITSVKIYPSDYGLERMKIEEMKGPVELVEKSLDAEEPSEKPEGSKFHMEKLRKYQLNRLKYYYAVIECDRPETANKIYEELDGMEYESSATQMDLRFIPDDVSFDHEPSSVAHKLPDATKYEANLFTTTALQQAKVDLTWDETNPDRIKTMQKAFKEADDVDLKAYLASASSSEGEESNPSESEPQTEKTHPKDQIEKYKQLLASIEDDERRKNERDVDMQITWEPGLKEKTENLIKTKYAKEDQTPFEEYLEKKKEKKKQKKKERKEQFAAEENSASEEQPFSDDDLPSDVDLSNPYFKEEVDDQPAVFVKKNRKQKGRHLEEENEKDPTEKAELELLLMDNDDGKKHFNLHDLIEDATQSKRKKKKFLRKKWLPGKAPKVDDFQVNTTDPRFAALYSSPLFNIDPSDPHFKKTKGIEAIIVEKQRKRHLAGQPETKVPKTGGEFESKGNPALSLLVKSIKSKTERFKRAKT